MYLILLFSTYSHSIGDFLWRRWRSTNVLVHQHLVGSGGTIRCITVVQYFTARKQALFFLLNLGLWPRVERSLIIHACASYRLRVWPRSRFQLIRIRSSYLCHIICDRETLERVPLSRVSCPTLAPSHLVSLDGSRRIEDRNP